MRGRRFGLGALVLGALAYTAWPAELVLPTGLSARDAYVSELGAAGRPYAGFFRTSDLIAGLLLTVAGILLARDGDRLGWGAYAVLGPVTVLDAADPMTCAPSLSASCRTAGGLLPSTTHEWTSVLAYVCFVVGTAALWWRWRRRSRLVRLAGPPVLAVLALTGIASVVLLGAPAGNGIVQRVQLLAGTLWLLGPAVRIASGRPDSASPAGAK